MPGLGHGPHFASISGDLRALSADAPFQARTGSSAAASALSSKAACAGLVTACVSPVSSSMSLPGRSTQRMQGAPLNGAHQEKLSGRSNGATGNAAQFVRCVGFCRLRLACLGHSQQGRRPPTPPTRLRKPILTKLGRSEEAKAAAARAGGNVLGSRPPRCPRSLKGG